MEIRSWYPTYPADVLSDEKVLLMNLEQFGAYRLLLDIQWREGSLPATTDALAMLAFRTPHETFCDRIWPALSECFPEVEEKELKGRRRNPRMARIRREQEELAEKKRAQATAAALTRWDHKARPPRAPATKVVDCDGHAGGNASAVRPHPDSNASAVRQDLRPQSDPQCDLIAITKASLETSSPPTPPRGTAGGEVKDQDGPEPGRREALEAFGFLNGEAKAVLATSPAEISAWKDLGQILKARRDYKSPLGYLKTLMVRYRHPDDAGLPWWPDARAGLERERQRAGEESDLDEVLEELSQVLGVEFQGKNQRWRIEEHGIRGVERPARLSWKEMGPGMARQILARASQSPGETHAKDG